MLKQSMIEEEVQVTALDEDGKVIVQKIRGSACSSCSQECSTKAVDGLLSRQPAQLGLHCNLDVKVGDRLIIGISENGLIRGSALIYLFPVASFFSGAISGKAAASLVPILSMDAWTAVGGSLGLLASLAALKFTRLLAGWVPAPVVLRKLS